MNTGNFFVVNLAIADLLITSVVGPFNMIGKAVYGVLQMSRDGRPVFGVSDEI